VRGLAEDRTTKQRALVVEVSVAGGPVVSNTGPPTVALTSAAWGADVSTSALSPYAGVRWPDKPTRRYSFEAKQLLMRDMWTCRYRICWGWIW
jgi:hypothetical protein